jgi:hypothetical protein
VPDLNPEKVKAARAFHSEIEDAARHRDDADYRDNGYRMHQVIGIEHPTL